MVMVLLDIAGYRETGAGGGFQLGNVRNTKMCRILKQCPTQLDGKPRVSLREALAKVFFFVTFVAR